VQAALKQHILAVLTRSTCSSGTLGEHYDTDSSSSMHSSILVALHVVCCQVTRTYLSSVYYSMLGAYVQPFTTTPAAVYYMNCIWRTIAYHVVALRTTCCSGLY
jgi:hypothetical protein